MAITDPEIAAMAQISQALDDVSEEARDRILNWVAQKYGKRQLPVALPLRSDVVSESPQFSDFPSLFHAANPNGQTEAALVAAYWLQVCKGQNDWDSQSANSELKNLGQPMSNITEAFTRLSRSDPRLIMQTGKSGSAKQARKKYKLTIHGIKKVQSMLAAQQQEH